MYVCASLPRDVFLAVLYGYKMILQVLALILAFSIRKVKVKGLNDAKYVGAAIYVTSMAQAVIILATFTLTQYVNAFAVLFSISFLSGTTVILLLVFMPLVRFVIYVFICVCMCVCMCDHAQENGHNTAPIKKKKNLAPFSSDSECLPMQYIFSSDSA